MDSTPVTVLIADDEPDMRLLVRMVLQAAEVATIEEAIDGEHALAVFENMDPPQKPAVMVLDNQMPGLTGLDVAALALAKYPEQRIILYSAHLTDGVVTEAQRLGVRACLAKEDIGRLPGLVVELAAG
jgi:DNA-binding NarL/FixJ family response regulator